LQANTIEHNSHASGRKLDELPRTQAAVLKRVRNWWGFRRAVTRAARADQSSVAGDKDVVVVPCWRRPEFLWHCLDNLTRAEGIGELLVVFRPDTGYSPDNLEVIDSYSDRLPNFDIWYPQPSPYRRTKQSANVLLGCLQAAAVARRLVFMVEEDIMVARDFFRWHRAVHAVVPKLFCSIAPKNPNRALTLPAEADGYYLSSGDYCSNGVCFDRQVLQTMIAPHVNMSYLRSPKKYIRRHFPASMIGLGFVEQDGLVRRIQERSSYPIAWPCVPRAFHSGFYGYNRPAGVEGSLRDRVQLLADTIYDREAMRVAAGRPEFIDTCMPCALETPEWSALHRVDVPMPPMVAAGA
jgi:hypothetical protein